MFRSPHLRPRLRNHRQHIIKIMKKYLLLLVVISAIVFIGCNKQKRYHTVKHSQTITKQHKVYRIHDGSFCYHDDNMMWFYLYNFQYGLYNSSAPTYDRTESYRSIANSGGSWKAGPAPAEEKDIQSIEKGDPLPEGEEQLVEAQADPIEISETVETTSMEVDPSSDLGSDGISDYGNSVESSESNSSDSSSSDSGSSDSGSSD